VFEKNATENFPPVPRPKAATERTPSDAAGKDEAILKFGLLLSFPAAATTTAVG
jgi:hypothetical protein